MAVAGYTQCRIQFIPNDGQRSEKDYSDRSLVELRQYDFSDYSIRALDIPNNKEEIFNIPFKKEEQYKRGQSASNPDEIRSTNGTYRLWLNAASRTNFHQALTTCIAEMKLLGAESPEPQRSTSPPAAKPNEKPRHNDNQQQRDDPRIDNDSRHYDDSRNKSDSRTHDNSRNKNDSRHYDDSQHRDDSRNKSDSRHHDDSRNKNVSRHYDDFRNESDSRPYEDPRHDNDQSSRAQPNRNDILVDVHQLGSHIRNGEVYKAVDLSKKLAKQRVQLQANSCAQQNEEKTIQIRVKVDSNDQKISDKDSEIEMNVYPSTTVSELRAAYEYSEIFPASSQYVFVNGHLAYENSTMADLKVRHNSLFVLFIIQQ